MPSPGPPRAADHAFVDLLHALGTTLPAVTCSYAGACATANLLSRRLVAEEADDGVRKRRSVVGDEQLLTRCGLDRSESGRRRDDRKRTRHRLEDLVLDPGAGPQRHDGDGRFV